MQIVGFKEERLQHPRRMSSFSYEEEKQHIFGFKDDFDTLVRGLTTKSELVISILGVEGIGKTTLARAIYRNGDIKQWFDFRIWVSVLKEHNTRDIMLIVLDGVRTSDIWEDISDAFPNAKNGGKLLFTSSKSSTAKEAIILHHLKPLTEEESWNMFLKKVTQEDAQTLIPEKLKKKILKICNGLPLNILLLAGLLSTKKISSWTHVLSSGESPMDVLPLCYSNLTVHLKVCLLYLVLFPKEFDIPVRRLLRLWLAEGFVQQQSTTFFPEDTVQKYFEDLVGMSMIRISKLRSDNSPRRCRLLGVLHDYLLPKAREVSLFFIYRNLVNQEDVADPFSIRRMVEYEGENQTKNRRELKKLTLPSTRQKQSKSSLFNPSQLRSYLSFNFLRKDAPAKAVGRFLGKIIDSGFGLLRVLDLEGVYKPSLPEKIGNLNNLRYLGLRWTFLDSLPQSVGDLPYLQTLDVKHTYIDKLPDSIWRLKHLRHLNLNNARLDVQPCSSLSLLTLWGLFLDEKTSVKNGLDKLLDLRELGITFHLGSSQGDLLDWITKLIALQSLRLRSTDDMGRPAKLVLKPMSKLGQLSHLNLLGNLERLPDPNEFPPTLKVLTLSISHLKKDPMHTLGQLPSLTVLRLLANSYLGKKMVCPPGGFGKLRVLKLWMLKELEIWDVEEGAMESLKELNIRCCHKLKNIPTRLLQQGTVEELVLTGMPDKFTTHVEGTKAMDTTLAVNRWEFTPLPWEQDDSTHLKAKA